VAELTDRICAHFAEFGAAYCDRGGSCVWFLTADEKEMVTNQLNARRAVRLFQYELACLPEIDDQPPVRPLPHN